MYILEKFLNKIALIPNIRADSVLENFLTMDSKTLEKEKTKFKKVKSVPVDKIETVDGEIDLTLGESSNTLISRFQKYSTLAQPEVKKYPRPNSEFTKTSKALQACWRTVRPAAILRGMSASVD